MNQYMVEITLPAFLSQDLIQLIPRQRAFVDNLFERGVITSYSLSLDRSKLWVTFQAKTVVEVEQAVESFPIIGHIEYKVHELAFYNAASTMTPAISLN